MDSSEKQMGVSCKHGECADRPGQRTSGLMTLRTPAAGDLPLYLSQQGITIGNKMQSDIGTLRPMDTCTLVVRACIADLCSCVFTAGRC